MRNNFKILDITHSGTKGERGTPVTANKYDGLIGCPVRFDTDDIHIGQSLTMYIVPKAHMHYDYWTISCIQSVDYDKENKVLVIETLNSIYYLQEVKHEVQNRKKILE